MSAAPRRVHQVLATLSYGDAIAHHAFAIQRSLRRAGFESDIFAETTHPRVSHLARALEEYGEVGGRGTVCLFHFAVGSAAGPLVYHAADRLVVVYHNITPAHHFLGYQNHVFGLCYHGRRELAAFAPRAELALGVSRFNQRELAAAGFARTGVLPIVPDLDAFRLPASRVVERLYGDGRTNVLFVGRIIPNKRIDDLIRAFAAYRRLDPRGRLLLVGDTAGCPHYHDSLLAMCGELGVRDVVFTGHVEDDELRAYYRASSVFLCLSDHEGYCVPLLEAMSFGVPVIAYDAGAVGETLRGGGVLLKVKRPAEVAELVACLTRDPALRSAVLATQQRTLDSLRAIDFDALLLDSLSPVLGERSLPG
jgi:glycosyltransferase involved in cell wall biosynthesis